VRRTRDHAPHPSLAGSRPQVFRGRFRRVRRHGLAARTGDDQPIRVGRRMREGPGQAVAAGRPLAVRG